MLKSLGGSHKQHSFPGASLRGPYKVWQPPQSDSDSDTKPQANSRAEPRTTSASNGRQVTTHGRLKDPSYVSDSDFAPTNSARKIQQIRSAPPHIHPEPEKPEKRGLFSLRRRRDTTRTSGGKPPKKEIVPTISHGGGQKVPTLDKPPQLLSRVPLEVGGHQIHRSEKRNLLSRSLQPRSQVNTVERAEEIDFSQIPAAPIKSKSIPINSKNSASSPDSSKLETDSLTSRSQSSLSNQQNLLTSSTITSTHTTSSISISTKPSTQNQPLMAASIPLTKNHGSAPPASRTHIPVSYTSARAPESHISGAEYMSRSNVQPIVKSSISHEYQAPPSQSKLPASHSSPSGTKDKSKPTGSLWSSLARSLGQKNQNLRDSTSSHSTTLSDSISMSNAVDPKERLKEARSPRNPTSDHVFGSHVKPKALGVNTDYSFVPWAPPSAYENAMMKPPSNTCKSNLDLTTPHNLNTQHIPINQATGMESVAKGRTYEGRELASFSPPRVTGRSEVHGPISPVVIRTVVPLPRSDPPRSSRPEGSQILSSFRSPELGTRLTVPSSTPSQQTQQNKSLLLQRPVIATPQVRPKTPIPATPSLLSPALPAGVPIPRQLSEAEGLPPRRVKSPPIPESKPVHSIPSSTSSDRQFELASLNKAYSTHNTPRVSTHSSYPSSKDGTQLSSNIRTKEHVVTEVIGQCKNLPSEKGEMPMPRTAGSKQQDFAVSSIEVNVRGGVDALSRISTTTAFQRASKHPPPYLMKTDIDSKNVSSDSSSSRAPSREDEHGDTKTLVYDLKPIKPAAEQLSNTAASRSYSHQAAAVSPTLLSRSPSDLELQEAVNAQLSALSSFLRTSDATINSKYKHQEEARDSHKNTGNTQQSRTTQMPNFTNQSDHFPRHPITLPERNLRNISSDSETPHSAYKGIERNTPADKANHSPPAMLYNDKISRESAREADDRSEKCVLAMRQRDAAGTDKISSSITTRQALVQIDVPPDKIEPLPLKIGVVGTPSQLPPEKVLPTTPSMFPTSLVPGSPYPQSLRKTHFLDLFRPNPPIPRPAEKIYEAPAEPFAEVQKEQFFVGPSSKPEAAESGPLPSPVIPFKLFSRRKRTVSMASVDCLDGVETTGASSVRSPTPGSPHMAPSPPWRDPALATHHWRDREEEEHERSQRMRRRRPGVTFELSEYSPSSESWALRTTSTQSL